MSTHHINPENALRKACDLQSVGQEEAAIEALNMILTSRRYRTWQPTHEKIMEKYIELAIKQRKNIRDALVKYRTISQDANIGSLETVINLYREKAEERAAKARLEAEAHNIKQDSADFEESPGSIMLQAVSGESAQDRKDQQILTPWVKYLWEGYRTILEILRNNAKLQHVYQKTARCAFLFCEKFKRPVEFRRLCDMLRKHLVTIAKYQHQSNSVDLNSPETQRLYLETRFQQLEIASNLELWQEAYRTIEDIHESMNLSKIPQTPTLMKTYYHQLAKIFWASGNYLFHAYSLSKYYALRCNEGIEGADKMELASAVLLATLAIEPVSSQTDADGLFNAENEENLRLANMLGFRKETPTRRRLISGLISRGILSQVSDVCSKIYQLTEKDFGPLTLNKKLTPLLGDLNKNTEAISKYVVPLHKLCILRVLYQLSRVYKTIKFASLVKIVPEGFSFGKLEKIIMDAVRFGHLSVRISHQTKVLLFNDEDMASDRMRNQLNVLAVRLQSVVEKIEPVSAEDKARERRHVFQSVERGIEEEHAEVFKRKTEIEKRKQEQESKQLEREKKEEEERVEKKLQREKDEQVRLEKERVEREAERVRREEEEKERIAKAKLVKDIRTNLDDAGTGKGKAGKSKAMRKLQKLTENVEEVDKASMLKAQAELVQSQKLESERKVKEQIRRLDFLTRAMRLEEKDLLVQSQEIQKKEEEVAFEADFKKFSEQHAIDHARAVTEKARLGRMAEQVLEYKAQLMKKRQATYEEEKAKQEARINAKRKEKEGELEVKRKADEDAQRIADEERAREEEERKKAEELAAAKALEIEEKRKEAEERRAKLNEVTRKQREREAELEAKEEERRRTASKPAERDLGGVRRGGDDTRGGGDGGGAWRPRGGLDRDAPRSGAGGRGDDRGRSGFGNRDDDRGRSGFGNRDDDRGRSGFGGNRDDDRGRSGFGGNRDDDRGRSGFGGNRDGGREESGGGAWRRPGARDDDRGSRSGFNNREDDRGRPTFGSRDDDRGRSGSGFGNRDDDRGRSGFGNRDDDRGRSGFGNRDDDRGRSGFGNRDRDAPRQDGGGDRWRPRGDDRGDRDSRPSGGGDGGDRWRPASRDTPAPTTSDAAPSKDAPTEAASAPATEAPPAAAEEAPVDDGFTVVKKGKKKGSRKKKR